MSTNSIGTNYTKLDYRDDKEEAKTTNRYQKQLAFVRTAQAFSEPTKKIVPVAIGAIIGGAAFTAIPPPGFFTVLGIAVGAAIAGIIANAVDPEEEKTSQHNQ